MCTVDEHAKFTIYVILGVVLLVLSWPEAPLYTFRSLVCSEKIILGYLESEWQIWVHLESFPVIFFFISPQIILHIFSLWSKQLQTRLVTCLIFFQYTMIVHLFHIHVQLKSDWLQLDKRSLRHSGSVNATSSSRLHIRKFAEKSV